MTVIYYHSNCMDGSAAALIARGAYPGAEIVPVQYGDPSPEIKTYKGKRVIVVDFSWKRAQMEQMAEHASQILVLDHHKTAESELRGLPFCKFDMNKSGARMAWEEWLKGEPPWWVLYIEDRDLWRWRWSMSKEINAAMRAYGLDPDSLQEVIENRNVNELQIEGMAIIRYQRLVVDQHVGNAEEFGLDGFKGRLVNATCLFSEIAGELAEGCDFGATYFEKANGERVFQLRSKPDGCDVSKLATPRGGGGHKHAAGFTRGPGV